MPERVAICAAAQTRFSPDRGDVSEGELAWEAIKQVLDQTGLQLSEIQSAVTCSQDFWDGRTISSMNIQPFVGAHLSHEDKVAEDGLNAIYCGMAHVLSGHHEIVLVVGHMKESQAEKSLIENCAFDPIFMRQLGVDFLAAAALQARRYLYKYGITPEQCARVAVKNRGNAKNNPFAQEPLDLTVEDVLASRMLASPIRKLDAKPVSDGACALILAPEARARKLTPKPVWILGASNCYEAHYLGDRDLAECDALVKAAQKAYRMAGIRNPARDIDMAEIYEPSNWEEMSLYEHLHFCGKNEGWKLVEKGVTEMEGEFPVNPSGGVIATNPIGATPTIRVAEAALQIRGDAGDHQVTKDVKSALASALGGPNWTVLTLLRRSL